MQLPLCERLSDGRAPLRRSERSQSNVSKALHNNHTYRLREDLGTGPRVYYIPAVAPEEA